MSPFFPALQASTPARIHGAHQPPPLRRIPVLLQRWLIIIGHMVQGLLSVGVPIVVAFITAIAASRLQTNRLRMELRTEFMAEEAIRQLLLHEQWRQRSFDTIQSRIGGFEADALRQLLVRAGAVRFKSREGEELWGLRERNKAHL
jgi:hypothetical protein